MAGMEFGPIGTCFVELAVICVAALSFIWFVGIKVSCSKCGGKVDYYDQICPSCGAILESHVGADADEADAEEEGEPLSDEELEEFAMSGQVEEPPPKSVK